MSNLPNSIPQPAWWQLLSWIADPLGFQDTYRQKYGDIFTMHLSGLGAFVLIGDPKMIQEIFNQDAKQFDIGRGNKIAEPLVGRYALMMMEGDRHRRERKLLMPPFHGERLQIYSQQICQLTKQVASQWQVGQPFIARTSMQKISLAVIMQIVFGLSEGKRYQQLSTLLADWLDMIDSPLRSSMLLMPFLQKDLGEWSPWGRMKQRQRQIHELLLIEIAERRALGDRGQTDVLSLLMAARDEQGQAMTDEELRDELMFMLFAGHETTATTLAWAFYQIHRIADVREKLLGELDSLGESPNLMEVVQLPYLSAVCQETLRMYPVIPTLFARITKSPIAITGHQFDADTYLMPSIHLVHNREDLYPEPKQFRPERFLERQYSPSEYIPFGGGSRRCLGYALAQLEIKLVLATVLANYQLALVEDRPIKPQRRGFTLSPAGGVQMVMTRKNE
ncbi:cytochrome P450 [Tumidithrix elongata RA019]|uniref:Cytochrome P450 n=1 Tax=Tumidithrix elongata BACA0141 TaxID=2716417 RepID=A0AAW9PVV8_9CYAN|nr:cytochrome P450 [Tumidithrix elongata RA019]